MPGHIQQQPDWPWIAKNSPDLRLNLESIDMTAWTRGNEKFWSYASSIEVLGKSFTMILSTKRNTESAAYAIFSHRKVLWKKQTLTQAHRRCLVTPGGGQEPTSVRVPSCQRGSRRRRETGKEKMVAKTVNPTLWINTGSLHLPGKDCLYQELQ